MKNFLDLRTTEGNLSRRLKDFYYKSTLAKRPRDGSNDDIQELPCKKTGRTLLLGDDLDWQVREYGKNLRECGAVVSTSIVQACAEGIVSSKNADLLASNGGWILLGKDWAKSLL